MQESNREWVFAERPDGTPDMSSFELRENDIQEPRYGELLVQVRYLSVDPYMRGRMRDAESYAEPWSVGEPMKGGIVGEVVESNSDAYDAGNLVTGNGTWADYGKFEAKASSFTAGMKPTTPQQPTLSSTPASYREIRQLA